ncbi:urate hydroxylase PuuD [Thalassolituus alkanivorans]|uniref:urate hydroxylase PuuD n=1 Tax=Thalassolituus alkanivorans TaxID=2881055 RepID=UPI001E65CB0B|nr:urate hydroxylase PuuD [Thalassolituus alkanivorans]MCB2384924.1 urate hydroxylase PuuD [Thalassolituus alkanivorans]MCB2424821.1 urate hydroxylase PuuD [Thalassolituus alkanivorans]
MEGYIFDWLNLFLRWFHVLAGIAWIGASFYFVWLDLSLEKPSDENEARGIKGQLSAIHGGGFYEVVKYKLGPQVMPANLHWFKWEAYTTWLTGFSLLAVMYYWGAQQYLIDPAKVAFSPAAAIGSSLLFLAVGFAVYELLIKSPLRNSNKGFASVLFVFLVFMAWLADQLFADRAAYIHVGALIGSIMAGNVFFGIMPSQRELVRAVTAGETPDARYAMLAKLRSTHNNYLTLPLVFIMISNHYPMTYGHEYAWLVLAMIAVITGLVRHFLNLKTQGAGVKPGYLISAFILTVALAFWMAPKPVATVGSVINADLALHITHLRCAECHAESPTSDMFKTPPAGIILESEAQLLQYKDRMLSALQTGYMPLANITAMTEDERAQLIVWLQAN